VDISPPVQTDIVFAELGWGAPEVTGEVRNGADVGVDRLFGKTSNAQILDHALA
jgi:hypothetical protein